MKINRNNYEHWLIDYMEGNLKPDMIDEVRSFLADNPDIARELDGLNEVGITADDKDTFPAATAILAATSGLEGPDTENIDTWLAARLENDLSSEQEGLLDTFLVNNPDFVRQASLMEMTKLEADQSVRMPSAVLLKRTQTPIHITSENLDDWLVAMNEGECNEAENAAITAFLTANPNLEKQADLMRLTVLTANETITMPAKDKMRRFVIPVVNQRTGNRILSIAASIILLFAISITLPNAIDIQPANLNLATVTTVVPEAPALMGSHTESFENQDSGERLHNTSFVAQTARRNEIESITTSYAANTIPARSFIGVSPSPVARHMIAAAAASDPMPDVAVAANTSPTLTLQEYGALRMRQFTYGDTLPQSFDSNVSRWELADAGVTGINRLTGGKLRFERAVDSDGKMKVSFFGTNRLHFARK